MGEPNLVPSQEDFQAYQSVGGFCVSLGRVEKSVGSFVITVTASSKGWLLMSSLHHHLSWHWVFQMSQSFFVGILSANQI